MAAAAPAPAPAPVLVQTVENLVLYPSSKMLVVGDDTRTYWARVMMLARAQESFKYPAGHIRAGQLNEDVDSKFNAWEMTTVEGDLLSDTMQLQGPGDNEEEKLNGATFAVPDIAPPDWVTFKGATAAQVHNHLSRKCSDAVTVSSMVQDMRSKDFDPDREELGA